MKVSTQMTYINVAYAITVIVRFYDIHAQSMEGKNNRGKEYWNDAQKKGPTTVYYFQLPYEDIIYRLSKLHEMQVRKLFSAGN